MPRRAVRRTVEPPGPPLYAPDWETRSQYLRRVEREYCAPLEQQYRDAGFDRAPANRSPDHARWLVAYQVGGLSLGKLARRALGDDTEANRSTIWKAITRVAADLKLPLAPPRRRGRPRAARSDAARKSRPRGVPDAAG
jgi:hypothetical protein